MVADAKPLSKARPREKAELTEVKRMQHDAYRKAQDVLLSDRERRSWMRTYVELSERRRILAGKPLPGSLVHEKVSLRKQARQLSSIMVRYPEHKPDYATMHDSSGQSAQPSESSAPSDQPS